MRVELLLNPLKEHLAILEIIETEHKLYFPDSDEKGDIESVIRRLVMSAALNSTKDTLEQALSFL